MTSAHVRALLRLAHDARDLDAAAACRMLLDGALGLPKQHAIRRVELFRERMRRAF
jgi:hypothetical protein